MPKNSLVFLLALCPLLFFNCRPEDPTPVDTPDNRLSGGVLLSTFDQSENAFGHQANGLTFEEDGFFVAGNALFQSNWVTAPASVQSLDGLGPLFNVSSCGGCHFKDGRAKPPATPDAPLNGLLFRLSVPGSGPHGEPLGDPNYGGQLQDRSILNVLPEAKIRVSYTEQPGAYPDGNVYALRQPVYTFQDFNFGPLAANVQVSPRIAQQLPGLGLLEAIPESAILALADEQDRDNDGISGRANYVWDTEQQQTVLGRFGWKANQSSLRQQAAGAFNGDIGITSAIFPLEGFTDAQWQQYGGLPNGGQPELTEAQLAKITFYLQTLCVPARRNPEDALVKRGAVLFGQLGCAKCHVPSLQTGTAHPIAVLNHTAIAPYTDLLLHDMGEGLADNRPDFLATGREWRTPPLWGIGMVPTVNKHSYLLHDGRARNFEEAILWHGGEAAKSQTSFTQLTKADREAVLRFLENL